MRTPSDLPVAARLGGFAAVLVAVFAAAFGIGACGSGTANTHGSGHAAASNPAASGHESMNMGGGAPMGGLAGEQDGYRLVAVTSTATVGTSTAFQFRVERSGEAVKKYTANHEKDLHLIIARTDLARELHVHPMLGSDGTWTIPVTFDTPGTWRAIADFIPDDKTSPIALGSVVEVTGPGNAAPEAVPTPGGQVDDYTVSSTGKIAAGRASSLTFTVARGGAPVTDLRRHLGALAHLVVLRTTDLGYLHVHPLKEDGLDFEATFPTPGSYRMFVEFDHAAGIHTATFDVTVV